MGIMTIANLTEQTTVAASDQIPISGANGTRRVSVTNLAAALEALATASPVTETAYSSPLTGASLAVVPVTAGSSVWLIITPLGALATLAIVLPGNGSTGGAVAADGQEVLITTSQTLTALAISSVGKTTSSAPTTLAQFGAVRMRYNAISNTWIKVGAA